MVRVFYLVAPTALPAGPGGVAAAAGHAFSELCLAELRGVAGLSATRTEDGFRTLVRAVVAALEAILAEGLLAVGRRHTLRAGAFQRRVSARLTVWAPGHADDAGVELVYPS